MAITNTKLRRQILVKDIKDANIIEMYIINSKECGLNLKDRILRIKREEEKENIDVLFF